MKTRKSARYGDDEKEKWFFCVVDVVEALTDSKDPKDYIKKMKKRDQELSKGWGQIVTPLSVQTAGGKQRVNCAPRDGIFRRIIGTGLSLRFIMKKNERILCGSLVFFVPLALLRSASRRVTLVTKGTQEGTFARQ